MQAEKRVKESQHLREKQGSPTRGKASFLLSGLKQLAIVAAAALGGFVIGSVPMWFVSESYRVERDSVVRTLRPSVLQNDLATATINAGRGEFEQARQQTSSFFTDLRAELESNESAFGAEQHEALKSILEQRDDTITLLARRDPASADRLTDLYFVYLQLKNSAAPKN